MDHLTPKRLGEIRGVLGLSQEHMARLLGASFASVNRWEGGESSFPSGATLDIYRAFDFALRAGHRPETILAGSSGDRGQFLLRLFQLAYAGRRKTR
jgi:transcriptional regulator with XRE-family HTH domain